MSSFAKRLIPTVISNQRAKLKGLRGTWQLRLCYAGGLEAGGVRQGQGDTHDAERSGQGEEGGEESHLHVQCTLGLGCLLSGAVADQSAALGQAEVKGQQGPVLHADGTQGGAVDLRHRRGES